MLDFNIDKNQKSTSPNGSQVDSASRTNLALSVTQKNASLVAKVEKINMYVSRMVGSKKIIDCALNILAACKDTYANLGRATIFFVDQSL